MGQTHLGCASMSPLGNRVPRETLQLLKQLSLPRGGRRTTGLSRYESLHLSFRNAKVPQSPSFHSVIC